MPELSLEIAAKDSSDPLGWLVIDSSIRGRSHGGVRISQTTGPEELAKLAFRMTLKFGFLGIPAGGAKAGIIEDPEAPPEIRQAKLKKFAQELARVVEKERFLPHTDMGTSVDEIEQAFGLPATQRSTRRKESGHYTGLGVAAAARAAARIAGKHLGEMSVAVEGFGKVGSATATILEDLGARIVAVSTSFGGLYRSDGLDVEDLLLSAQRYGSRFVLDYEEAERISSAQLLRLPVDILSPCADSHTIDASNAGGIQAGIICAGANCPVTSQGEQILQSRDVILLPDFLTSCGGILGGTMAFAGVSEQKIHRLMFDSLESRFVKFFSMPSLEVQQECLRRFQQMKEKHERNSASQKLFQFGMTLYRNGWIPKLIVSRLAARYIISH